MATKYKNKEKCDPIQEEKKRRKKEKNELDLLFSKKDVRDIPMSIIDFQVMYEDSLEDAHLPLEVGFVWLTFNAGIIHELHKFINPGDPPLGNRSIAMDYSESSHKIPINFEEGETDCAEIWSSLEKFLYRGGTNKSPFLFCLGSKRDLVENCLSYIHSRSGTCRPFMFSRLFCLEDLFSACLLLSSEKISLQPSDTEISDLLNSTKWDYENSIRCCYHASVDSVYCSLSIVKRYSFFMFDYFCDILMFKLTPSHVPDESEANFKILTPPASKAKTYRELKKPTSSKSKRPKPNFQTPTIPRLMSVLTKHEPVCEHMLVREQSLNSEPEKNKAFCEPVGDPFCEPVSEPSPEENFYKPVQIPRIVISEDGSGSGSSEDVILDDSDCSDSIYMNSRNHPLQVVREPYNLRQVVREPHTSAEAMMRKFNHTFISSSPEQQNRSESGNAVSFVPPPGFCHLSQDDSAHQGFNAWSAISPNFLPRSSSDRTSDSQDTICSSETSGKSKGSQGKELSNKSRGRCAHQTYLPRPQ